MKKLINFFIKYPTWPNVIKIMTLVFGLIAVLSLKSSFFPQFERQVIQIQITFPGASPEEIEKGIVRKIEDNLKGLQGIERYTSESRENIANITIETLREYDVDEVLLDVRNAVNRINSFPTGMEPLVVFKVPTIQFAISFAVSGDMDVKSLKTLARRIENDLRSIDGISQIELSGFPDEEIEILVSEKVLRSYGLSFSDIAMAVQQENIDLTAGSIKTDEEEIRIRIEAKEYYAAELKDIVVKSDAAGDIVRLGDIAEVVNTWEDTPQKTYIDNKRAVIITVNKLLEEDIIEVAEKTRAYVDEFREKHAGIDIIILDDATTSLSDRLDMLIENGILGVALVLLSLALFLDFRLAFWVALGLPFAFLGSFLMMYLAGITINVISLFGLLIVVGILVDDGIIIAEQIYQNYEQGKRPFTAAMTGTFEVLPSVAFAVITTIVAFTPFFFLDGSQGRNMVDMAFVVVVILGFSLIEASLILPSHLAHSRAIRKGSGKGKFREFLDRALAYPRDVWTAKTLRFFMKNNFLIIAIAIALSLLTIGAYQGGIIGATFFPSLEEDSFEISLELPAGTREPVTKSILDRIEKASWDVTAEMEKEYDQKLVEHIILKLGQGPTGLFGAVEKGGPNIGTIKVVMVSGERRDVETNQMANRIRERVGPVYSAEKLIYGGGSRFGKPISVSMLSNDLRSLQSATTELKSKLKQMPELKDIEDNEPEGLREIQIKLNDKARLLGFTNLQLAMAIRRGFFGAEAQRLQRGEDEIKVWVQYTDADRSSIGQFEDMRMRLPGGREYPVSELIDYTIGRSTAVINHLDGKRNITVEADLVNQNAEVPPILNRVMDEILAPILERNPGISLAESGQRREIFKTARSAQVAMPVAFVIMFFLVVLSFRSFTQALVVFSLLPLGFIGASWGHFAYGMPINMMSAYGIIALLGIIINDSIVYINTMNHNLQNGTPFREAVFETSINRFRPIVLTTVTTVLGLLPLLAETSRQARFLIPMAISVSAGLLFGSVLTIIFLPIFLMYMNKFRRWIKWLRTGEKPSAEEVEPAIIEQKKLEEYTGENNSN